MISSFRHKGLDAFFRLGTKAGIQAHHAPKLRILLTALEQDLTCLVCTIPRTLAKCCASICQGRRNRGGAAAGHYPAGAVRRS